MVNNINNLRIFRWVIACTIVMMSVNFMVNPAQAVTSSIVISNQSLITDYSGTTDKTIDWTTLSFYNASYTGAIYFEVENLNFTTFLTEGRSTNFVITSGGSGSGWASYVAATHGVYWYFSDSTVLTASNITLSYTTNIFADISLLPSVNPPCSAFDIEENHADTYSYSGGTVNVTMPFSINGVMNIVKHHMRRDGGCNWAEKSTDYNGSANTYVKADLTNNYEVTNILDDNYLVAIDKSVGVANTKITLEDISSNFYLIPPSTFDQDDYEVIINVTNGLVINMSNEGGTIEKETVNLIPSSDTSLIEWEFNSYDVGDTAHLSTNLTAFDNTNYTYEVSILKPNGVTFNNHYITANESDFDVLVAYPGGWYAYVSTYAKSEPDMLLDQDSDTTQVIGTSISSDSWIAFNDTYYTLQSSARIDYSISDDDYTDAHRMQIFNSEGTEIYNSLIVNQSGYRYFYWADSGIYTVQLRRVWFALDWDLSDYEVLASDTTEVTNTITGAYDLSVMPSVLNCGQIVYLSADTPNFWNTTIFSIKNVSAVEMANISGQSGSWRTNQTGQFWVYFIDDGAIQDTGYFEVYGTCTGYDQISPGSQGGIQPKPYPQTDQATSNANLQNNLLYFLGLPIFWGLIIYVGFIYMLAINGAGSTVPFVTPVIIFMELAIGMLDPYSAFVVVGVIIVYVLGFIAKVFSISVGDTVSSVTHIGKK